MLLKIWKIPFVSGWMSIFNSAVFSEGISSRKYPDYKKYQDNVPTFLGFVNRNWK